MILILKSNEKIDSRKKIVKKIKEIGEIKEFSNFNETNDKVLKLSR